MKKINDNTKKKSTVLRAVMSQGRIIVILSSIALMSVVITYVLYNYTQILLKERLQERLVAIVSTTATQIDARDVLAVGSIEDITKIEYERIVTQLEQVRDTNEDIQYSYIMRRTDDPDLFEFVADAEGLIPYEEQDFDGDGVVGDDEAVPMPGDPFEVYEYPALRDEAFFYPVASKDLEEDQWSVQLSAYAPIIDENGDAVAIYGIDVEVTDFKERTQAMLLPFLLFIFSLILLLTLMTIMLARVWEQRVAIIREMDRQKDELLSIVSHQLATPISAVKWNLEMMADGDMGKLTKDQEEHLKTIQPQTENLADLASMILDVSRVQLGRMKVDRIDMDVAQFSKDVFKEVEPKALEKGVKYTMSVSKDVPKMMLDKRLMRMTMENLLTNAVKYTPKGGSVDLKVEMNGKKLHYEVKDTGCGIPKKEHDKVFGKLFRASNVLDVSGNGFGLYVAKGAAESQGGTITFDSVENKGTTFLVDIPIVKESEVKKESKKVDES
ncbi:HAMP domain-containing histidine kinase [Patescibacteria group bacterium]|nr:HAMP domain-containing histidine kinase [Patescibacteria group bacterium]